MSALSTIFHQARSENRAALVGYLPAGFPHYEESIALFQELAQHVDLIEVGIPFTDPMMDGPTIQEAADIALNSGFRVHQVIDVVRAVTETGGSAVVMSYWNPILQYGPEKFAKDLAEAGGLGTIIPDLLPEEAEAWSTAAQEHGLDSVYLVAPSTTEKRLTLTTAAGGGFIYAASHMGVTGAQDHVNHSAEELVSRVREVCDLPVAVGLGVKNGEQARAIAAYADGVIVGSALITAAREGGVEGLSTLAQELAAGVRSR